MSVIAIQNFWKDSSRIQKFATTPENQPKGKMQLIISPIAATYKKKPGVPCSKKDYEEQMLRREKTGHPLMWDDSKTNKAQLGDKFAFVFNGDRLVVYTIVGIALPSERMPSWAENVGQTDRRVITLSSDHYSIPWHVWEQYGGCNCQGTSHVRKAIGVLDWKPCYS